MIQLIFLPGAEQKDQYPTLFCTTQLLSSLVVRTISILKMSSTEIIVRFVALLECDPSQDHHLIFGHPTPVIIMLSSSVDTVETGGYTRAQHSP